jgi:hypothetical protein
VGFVEPNHYHDTSFSVVGARSKGLSTSSPSRAANCARDGWEHGRFGLRDGQKECERVHMGLARDLLLCGLHACRENGSKKNPTKLMSAAVASADLTSHNTSYSARITIISIVSIQCSPLSHVCVGRGRIRCARREPT